MITEEDKSKFQNMNKVEINGEFTWACYEKNLDKIKYLLTSPELKEHADIHADNDSGFIRACMNGDLKLVKYLLTSPDLKEHANIHAQNNSGFIYACSQGYLEIIEYLLTSPELKAHADIHAGNDSGFTYACINKSFEIIDYFIIERNMTISDDLQNKLKEESSEGYTYALKLIEVRDFHNKLDSTLDIKDTKKIKRGKI